MSGPASEMAALVRLARRLGFAVSMSGTSHYRLTGPDGRVSIWSNSPGSGAAALKLRAYLRRFQKEHHRDD